MLEPVVIKKELQGATAGQDPGNSRSSFGPMVSDAEVLSEVREKSVDGVVSFSRLRYVSELKRVLLTCVWIPPGRIG